MITIIESETDFEHKYQFEIFGKEAIAVHKNNVKLDSYATIEFYIKSREWKDRFFNTLMVKNIHLEDNINYTVTENLPFS